MSHDPEDEYTIITADGIGKGILRDDTLILTEGLDSAPTVHAFRYMQNSDYYGLIRRCALCNKTEAEHG